MPVLFSFNFLIKGRCKTLDQNTIGYWPWKKVAVDCEVNHFIPVAGRKLFSTELNVWVNAIRKHQTKKNEP